MHLPTELKKIEKQYTLGLDEVMEEAQSYTGPNIDETFTRVLKYTTEFYRTVLLTLVKRVGEEVIGKDEDHSAYTATQSIGMIERNKIRQEQRYHLDEMLQTLEKKDL
jgi:hypothetical protein